MFIDRAFQHAAFLEGFCYRILSKPHDSQYSMPFGQVRWPKKGFTNNLRQDTPGLCTRLKVGGFCCLPNRSSCYSVVLFSPWLFARKAEGIKAIGGILIPGSERGCFVVEESTRHDEGYEATRPGIGSPCQCNVGIWL